MRGNVRDLKYLIYFLDAKKLKRVSRDGVDAKVDTRGGRVDDCIEVGMERDSACGYGSREHISKVCSQLIIGAPPPSLPPLSYPPPLHITGRMRYQGLKLRYSRGRTCTVIDRVQVQSTAAGKLQRGLAQAGRGYRCFVRDSRSYISRLRSYTRVHP